MNLNVGTFVGLADYETTTNERKFGYDVACERRSSVHPLHVSRCQMSGYFGGKVYGHLPFVKQRPTKESMKTKTERKAGDVFVSVLSKVLSLD